MAFPQSPLGIFAELQINGTWTDVSGDVRSQGGTEAITITRGVSSSGGMLADRGTCTLTLDNNTGRYSNRNPLSPYYGYIGRNTPIRVGVAYGTPWLDVAYGTQTVASTPDAAVLDIAGDIDIRVDAELPAWGDPVSAATGNVPLVTKYGLAGQRSWYLAVTYTGKLTFFWSADGTNVLNAASAIVPLFPGQRGSIRVTLDVDNGAAGNTVTFYTSTTAGTAGPWTQLGSPIVQAGTTALFNSTTPIEVGRSVAALGSPTARKYYGAEVRSGIGGTVVTNPNFEAQTVGATSFADTAPSPRTWTAPAGTVSNRYVRFVGEVSSWPPQWDTGGKDVTTPISGAGILQRYNQGKAPLQSTLRRRIPSANPTAYWPMEEGSAATQAASPIAGVSPMQTSGFTWAADSSLPGSAALPQLAPPSSMTAIVPTVATGDWHVECVYKLDTLPAAPTLMLQVDLSGGTASSARFSIGVAVARIQALDAAGAVIASVDISPPNNFADNWGRLQIKTSTSGGTVTLTASWLVIGSSTTWFGQALFTGTPGRVTAVKGTWGSAFAPLRIGHVSVRPAAGSSPYDSADIAFDGDNAAGRLARVASEQGLPMSVAAHEADTELLGPQPQGTLLDVLTATAQADEGYLHEAREFLGLRYRGRASLYNQPPALDLPYTASPQPLMAPLTPVDDDQSTRNDTTVTRTNGSSGRVTVTTGPLSTQPPPAGVGTYDEAITLNLHTDDQTTQHAGWRTYLGTWDEARFPQVNIELAKKPTLIPAVSRIETGSRIRVMPTLPSWLPPDAIDQLVTGYTETLAQFSWRMSFACQPYGPYRLGVLDDTALGRLDTDGTVVAAAVSSTATSLPVTVTSGPLWTTDPAQMPIGVRVGGETMTATAITSISDAFGRTVSSGWGTADTGQAWTITGGSASDFAVSSGTGQHSCSSRNVFRFSTLPAPGPDADVRTGFSTAVTATGGSLYAFLMARYTGVNDFYFVRLEMTTAAGMILTLRKRTTAGGEVQLATVTLSTTHTAGTLYSLRLACTGSTISGKCWPAGSAEPDWQVTATDTDITVTGAIGVRSLVATANTNTLPVVIAFDNFALLNQQTMTVTRSVNGIVKAQAAGTDVRLTQPLTLAL